MTGIYGPSAGIVVAGVAKIHRTKPERINRHGETDMRIACTGCGTIYKVSADQIPEGGRKLRCSSCKSSFLAHPRDLLPDEAADGSKSSTKPLGIRFRKIGAAQVLFAQINQPTLLKLIGDGRALMDDDVSIDGGLWRKLGSIAGLQPAFMERQAKVDAAREAEEQAAIKAAAMEAEALPSEGGQKKTAMMASVHNPFQEEPAASPPPSSSADSPDGRVPGEPIKKTQFFTAEGSASESGEVSAAPEAAKPAKPAAVSTVEMSAPEPAPTAVPAAASAPSPVISQSANASTAPAQTDGAAKAGSKPSSAPSRAQAVADLSASGAGNKKLLVAAAMILLFLVSGAAATAYYKFIVLKAPEITQEQKTQLAEIDGLVDAFENSSLQQAFDKAEQLLKASPTLVQPTAARLRALTAEVDLTNFRMFLKKMRLDNLKSALKAETDPEKQKLNAAEQEKLKGEVDEIGKQLKAFIDQTGAAARDLGAQGDEGLDAYALIALADYYRLGVMLSGPSQAPLAEEYLVRAEKNSPSDPHSVMIRGALSGYRPEGRQAALMVLQGAYDKNKRMIKSLFMIARIQLEGGAIDQAKGTAAKILAAAPEHSLAKELQELLDTLAPVVADPTPPTP